MYEAPRFCERPFDLRVVFDLVSKLPSLITLDCPYIHERLPYPYEHAVNTHYSRPWEGPRRDTRHDFVNSTPTESHPTLKKVKINFGEVEQLVHLDQRKPLPDLVMPLAYDPLSSALRIFSQELCLSISWFVETVLFFGPRRTNQTPHHRPGHTSSTSP